MNAHEDIIRIKHMFDAAHKAVDFMNGKSREDLDTDEMLALALVRLIEIFGEAAHAVSQPFKEKHPDVPWQSIIGTRNRLIHGYFDVDLDIIWNIVTKDLPPLIIKLQGSLSEYQS